LGHRANYLILEASSQELFYSHWSANSVERNVFWGPQPAERFIRCQEATSEWLDDTWCEGGAVLDKVARELLVFGGEDILYDLYRRSVWMALMKPLWPGWSIRWATREIVDLAARAGVPPSQVLARRQPEVQGLSLRPTTPGQPWCDTLVTWHDTNRQITLQDGGKEVLRLGPDLLRRLGGIKARPVVDENPPRTGLEIHAAGKRLLYWESHGMPTLEEEVARRWAGWQVLRDDGRAFEHLASLSVFTPASEEGLLQDLLESLTREYSSPVNSIMRLLADKQAEGHRVEVNPHALLDARSELSDERKAELLAYAVGEYRARGGAPCYGKA
jgi:hypothetical protein